MSNNIKINLFLVGVQKSATTSIYDWISQHPDVCGPVSMKDTPFFIDDALYNKGEDFLKDTYQRYYKNEKVIINGSAHNIYISKALERINRYNPESRIILILRDPVERAISAYNFAKKRNLEIDDIYTSIEKEKTRLESDDLQILTETTYIDHGYYFKQLQVLKKYFSQDQILVLFYNDVRENPKKVVNEIYDFLEIDTKFEPTYRSLNKTGSVRFKHIKNIIYNNSKLKKFLVKNVLDVVISYDLKYRIKLSVLRLITKENRIVKNASEIDIKEKDKLNKYLYNFFIEDINKLEKVLDKDLSHWKVHNK